MKSLTIPLKYLLFIIFTCIVIIATLPKKNLYFLAENYLQKHAVIITNEKINDGFFNFSINNAELIYKDIPAGMLKRASVQFYPHRVTVKIDKLILNRSIKNLFPADIKNMQLQYSLLNPLELTLTGESDLGEVKGGFKLLDMNASMELYPKQRLNTNQKNLLKFMDYRAKTKDREEVYTYEYSLN